MVGPRRSGPGKATATPLSRRQAWWGKHRRSISRLTATWRQESSEPYALEEEIIEADEEEAKAMAGFLGFMAGHGGRAPAIVYIRFTVGFSMVCVKYVMNFVQFVGKVFEM